MKFFHLSDLHIGKRLNEFSLLDDQDYILKEILRLADEEKPDGVLIAGDVYDKSLPAAEAVTLLDTFLVALSEKKIPVYLISGNHDSAERLAFMSRVLSQSGIHISPVYSGAVTPITVNDAFGAVNLYLLPFVKPANVRAYAEESERDAIESYTDAIAYAIGQMKLDTKERNILLCHQFVTGAARSDSETVSVGGSDNVAAEVFDDFDYVALGHIHTPQSIGRETLRYSGTPLPYSFSETAEKSVTVVELLEKGNISVSTRALKPRRKTVTLKGKYEELMAVSYYAGTTYREDFVRVILTDEEDVFDAIGKLRTVYQNVMAVEYDNARTRKTATLEALEDTEIPSPFEVFRKLYETQNNAPMTDEQNQYLAAVIEDIFREDV